MDVGNHNNYSNSNNNNNYNKNDFISVSNKSSSGEPIYITRNFNVKVGTGVSLKEYI